MNIKCPTCGTRYQTRRSDPTTWSCPTCAPGRINQRFTVETGAEKTQFTTATRPV